MERSRDNSLFNRISLWICLLLFALAGCEGGSEHPNVDHINVQFDLNRVDQLLRNKDSSELVNALSQLSESYPNFAAAYYNTILPLGNATGDSSYAAVIDYILNDDIRQLSDTIQDRFPNNEYLKEELNKLFRFYQYYYPSKSIPDVFTYHSAFNYGVASIDEKSLGIGLDFFLGESFEAYHPSLFPDFIRRTMSKEYLAPRVAEVLIKDLIPPAEKFRFLDRIIYEGKVLHFMRLLLPKYPDSLLFQYSNEKIEWMRGNEAPTWTMILKQEWLYSQKTADWIKMVSPSPSGPSTMPQESPGEAGSWIGAKIIAELMRRNPEMTPIEILKMSDSQEILDLSKYKPR